MRRIPCVPGKIEVGAVASVRTKFSRQQPDQSEPRPLTNPEGLEQLLLGMFPSKRDRIHGGNWQRAPRAANAFSSKVLRIEPRIKSIRREEMQTPGPVTDALGEEAEAMFIAQVSAQHHGARTWAPD